MSKTVPSSPHRALKKKNNIHSQTSGSPGFTEHTQGYQRAVSRISRAPESHILEEPSSCPSCECGSSSRRSAACETSLASNLLPLTPWHMLPSSRCPPPCLLFPHAQGEKPSARGSRRRDRCQPFSLHSLESLGPFSLELLGCLRPAVRKP